MNINKTFNEEISIDRYIRYLLFGLFIIFLSCFFYLFFEIHMDLDTDMIWHYLIGRDIINNHSISFDNPYSWIKGTKWTQQEWLFDVFYYLICKYLGTVGSILLYIFSILTLVIIGYKTNKVKNKYFYLFFIILLFIMTPVTRINRPERFSTLLLPVLVFLIKRNKIYVPVVFFISGLFLANFHAGQGMGIFFTICVYIGISFFYYILNKDIINNKKNILYMISDMCLYIIGFTISPFGFQLFMEMFSFTKYETTKKLIEWQPLFKRPYPVIISCMFIYILLLIPLISVIKTQLKINKKIDHGLFNAFFLYLFCFIMTVYTIRFSTLLLIIAITICYKYTEFFFTAFVRKKTIIISSATIVFKMTIISAFIGFFVYTGYFFLSNKFNHESYIHNQIIKNYISENMLKRIHDIDNVKLIHGYHMGDIFMFENIPVFVDTRQLPYVKESMVTDSCDTVLTYVVSYDFNPQEDFLKYDYNYIMISPNDYIYEIMDKLDNNNHYLLIFEDDFGNKLYKHID